MASTQISDADLRAELARLRQQMQFNTNSMAAGYDPQLTSRYNALAAQINSRAEAAAANREDPAARNRQQALDLTQGRGDALMNDPRITAALDILQGNATTGPYSDAVVNQLANRQADGNATIAANQAQALRDQLAARGGNPNDPSFQAALNAADTARMQANNAGRGDLESRATLENYDARGRSAQALAGTRLSQMGSANQQYNQAAGLLANEQFDSGQRQSMVPSFTPSFSVSTKPTAMSGGFDFSDYFGGNESPQPAPAPLPVVQPKQTPAPKATAPVGASSGVGDGRFTPYSPNSTSRADAMEYSGVPPWMTKDEYKNKKYLTPGSQKYTSSFTPEF